jgi:hypothetical protein
MREQGFMDLLLSVYRQGKPFHGYEQPAYFVRPDGAKDLRYMNFVYQPYREPNGTISGVLVLAHDVTEGVTAKRSVFESEERLRIALESVAMGTWETVPQSDTLYFSDRCKEIFGFPLEADVLKQQADDAIVPADKQRVAAAIDAALAGQANGQYHIEYGIIQKNSGLLRTVRASGQAFFKEGIPYRFIGTIIDITEEVAARDTHRKLLTLIDNSIELMSVLELDGKNSYINKAGMEMLGFDSFQQMLETPVSELHTPEDAAFVHNNVLPVILKERSWSGMMKVRHLKTGEVFPVYNNTVRIDDPETGQPIAIGAVMRDMRPELAAQQALVESEAAFRNMILQSPVAMCLFMGADHVVEIANEDMFELWGKSADAVLGKPIFEGLPEAKEQGFEQLLKGVFTTGEEFIANEYPTQLPRGGGLETVYINFVYAPFRKGDGSIQGIIATAVDVTTQVVARQKIEYAEERARLAIESADLGTFEINLLTGEMHTSERFKRIWGYDFALSREGYASVIHPDDQLIRQKAFADSMKTGNLHFEVRVIWKDASVHWIKAIGKLFYDDKGTPTKLLGIVQDITDQKLFAEELARQVDSRTAEIKIANEQLRQINAELEQFAYVSSHDLQEPLRKIRMFTEMVQDSDGENLSPSAQTRLVKITDAAQRMSTSLKDLLNFSSLSKEEQFASVDLNGVVNAVLTDLELAIQQKEAMVYYEELPTLRAIPLQMHQLFYNLLNNALKFAKKDESPLITISSRLLKATEIESYPHLKADRQYCELVVKDNGIGFKQDTASKIFLLFQRLHDRQSYSGTGIGLALCKKVALNHDGDIFARSAPGEGASFHVLLPIS